MVALRPLKASSHILSILITCILYFMLSEEIAARDFIVPVEVTQIGENAVTAKEIATKRALEAAVVQIIKQYVSNADYKKLPELSEKTALNLVTAIRYLKEEAFHDRYYARFDISISSTSLENYLRRHGVTFINQRSPAILIVPAVLLADKQIMILDASSPLFLKTKQNFKSHILSTLVKSPANTYQDTDLNSLLNGQNDVLGNLAMRYQVNYVTILLTQLDVDADINTITLIGWDSLGSFKKTFMAAVDKNASKRIGYVQKTPLIHARLYLEERWKKAFKRGEKQLYQMTFPRLQGIDFKLSEENGSISDFEFISTSSSKALEKEQESNEPENNERASIPALGKTPAESYTTDTPKSDTDRRINLERAFGSSNGASPFDAY